MEPKFQTEREDWIFIIPTTKIWLSSLIITAWDYIKLQKTHNFSLLNLLGSILFLVGLITHFAEKRTLGDNYTYGLKPPHKDS